MKKKTHKNLPSMQLSYISNGDNQKQVNSKMKKFDEASYSIINNTIYRHDNLYVLIEWLKFRQCESKLKVD